VLAAAAAKQRQRPLQRQQQARRSVASVALVAAAVRCLCSWPAVSRDVWSGAAGQASSLNCCAEDKGPDLEAGKASGGWQTNNYSMGGRAGQKFGTPAGMPGCSEPCRAPSGASWARAESYGRGHVGHRAARGEHAQRAPALQGSCRGRRGAPPCVVWSYQWKPKQGVGVSKALQGVCGVCVCVQFVGMRSRGPRHARLLGCLRDRSSKLLALRA
jgi:hypothetical protein